MINYEELIKFLIKNKLTIEEFLLLQTAFLLKEENGGEYLKYVTPYYGEYTNYGEKSVLWVDIIISLEKRGFLTLLKPFKFNEKTKTYEIKFSSILLTDKFRNIVFVEDKDNCWELFVKMYPKEGSHNGGMNTFVANTPKKGDKEAFFKTILKNGDRLEWLRIYNFFDSIFELDKDDKATVYAGVNITNFIAGFDQHIKNWEEGNKEQSKSDWRARQL